MNKAGFGPMLPLERLPEVVGPFAGVARPDPSTSGRGGQMKRYDLEDVGHTYAWTKDLIERKNGDWVKFEEVEVALQEATSRAERAETSPMIWPYCDKGHRPIRHSTEKCPMCEGNRRLCFLKETLSTYINTESDIGQQLKEEWQQVGPEWPE